MHSTCSGKGTTPPRTGISRPRNGIPICKQYQTLLDDASIAIVPAPDGQGLIVTVLDKGFLNEGESRGAFPKGTQLENRVLQFKTDFRLGLRYLYFSDLRDQS